MAPYAIAEQPRTVRSIVFEVTLLPVKGAADSRPRTFVLDGVRRIGADAANHIVIEGAGIGAFHARFIPGPEAPILFLDGSDALLNGVGIEGSVGLLPGDVLSFGEHDLRVSAPYMDESWAAAEAVVWTLASDDGSASIRLNGEVLIGSAANCTICLADAGIAARHAQLVRRGATLWVRDFSDGATFVNAQPVSGARPLQGDDVLTIGLRVFRVIREVRIANERSEATVAVEAIEGPDNASVPGPRLVSETFSAAALQGAGDSESPCAVWEIDEPIEIPEEEGLAFEPTVEIEPISVRRAASTQSPRPRHVPVVARSPVGVRTRPPVGAVDRPVASAGIPPSHMRRRAERSAHHTRKARWRVPVLILVLTAVWAVAMRPPGYGDPIDRMPKGREIVDGFDTMVRWVRVLQHDALTWLQSRAAANLALHEPESAVEQKPSEQVAVSSVDVASPDTPPAAEEALATPDIVELQRKASAGDVVAIEHLKELNIFYARLASSATARGDTATAQRNLAMAQLMKPKSVQAEAAVAAPPPSSVQRATSRVEALVAEARRLQSQSAVFAPDGRNVISVLVEALLLDPAHAGARRHLNLVVDSLDGRINTLIADHRFPAAGSLLVQLSRDGIPVLSNGNVRDRPAFLDARVWRSLAVSSLLVEADELIQQGVLATPGRENAISRLEVATRLDPANPLVEDMQAKSSGMLFLAAEEAGRKGLSEEATRLSNLASYVRDGFGA